MKLNTQLTLPVLQVSPLGIGIVPPARNLADFAGDGGHRRLGDGARDALALERLQRRREVHPRRDPAERRRRVNALPVPLTENGLVATEKPFAARARAAHVDAELLDDVAADFADRHPQADLVEAADGQRIDHLAGQRSARRRDADLHRRAGSAGAGRRLRGVRGAAQHRGADEAAGDVERLLRFARRVDRAHQDDRNRRPS